MYERLTTTESNALAKEKIETLEKWLRDLIVYKLGTEFYNAQRKDGGYYIANEELREEMKGNNTSNAIGKTNFTTYSEIICSKKNFNEAFAEVFKTTYPSNLHSRLYIVITEQLQCLAPARNDIMHSRNIKMHDLERVICYSHDIINAIRTFYEIDGKEREFNVPSFVKIKDRNLGIEQYKSNFPSNGSIDFSIWDLTKERGFRVGETILLEVDVDTAFDENEYRVVWEMQEGERFEGKNLNYKIKSTDIGERYHFICYLYQNKEWHRYVNRFDDMITLVYKILPS